MLDGNNSETLGLELIYDNIVAFTLNNGSIKPYVKYDESKLAKSKEISTILKHELYHWFKWKHLLKLIVTKNLSIPIHKVLR